MAHPGNAVVAEILEYSSLLMDIYIVIICPVSLDCTIYMLGVFAIEVSHLIGTSMCLLFKTRHKSDHICGFRPKNKAASVSAENPSWCLKTSV